MFWHGNQSLTGVSLCPWRNQRVDFFQWGNLMVWSNTKNTGVKKTFGANVLIYFESLATEKWKRDTRISKENGCYITSQQQSSTTCTQVKSQNAPAWSLVRYTKTKIQVGKLR